MGFLRIFYVRKKIAKIFLISYNLVYEAFWKILVIGVTLAVPSSLHINSRKFTKYPPTISKNVLNKCLNNLLVFAQSWFDYLCFFYENYKQLYSRNIFRRIFDLTHEKYTCKMKTTELKSKRLLKNRFRDMSSLSHFVASTQNYFSYSFEVDETPGAAKDEKESPDSKENMDNEEVMDAMSADVPPHKEDMDPSCITMDTEHHSFKNVHSGHRVETVKKKPDGDYVHKLKRPRNTSQTSSSAKDASRTNCPQEQLVSKDETFLSSNPCSESLSRESEEQKLQSSISAHRFGASGRTEDLLSNFSVNFRKAEIQCLESMKRIYNTIPFNADSGNDTLVMTKDELYNLGTDESEIQEGNLDQSDFNEKYGNETRNISVNEKFLPLKIDESNPEKVMDVKKLSLLPSNERWKDTADEINDLKKQIARKDRVCEFKRGTEDFSSNVFSLISEKSKQGIGASRESDKTSNVKNQSNVVQELSCTRNEDNEKRHKVVKKNLDIITNLSPEAKTSSCISKKNDMSNTSSSISSKKMLSEEYLQFLVASYFQDIYERDSTKRNSGSLDQEMHPCSAISLDDSGNKSATVALGSQYDCNVSPMMSKFQRELPAKYDLNADLELPYVSSILYSPVSEKECPMSRNEANRNLTIANPRQKKVPSSKGNPNQDFGNLSNVRTRLRSNYSHSNQFRLPLPNFAVSENDLPLSVSKQPRPILSPGFTQSRQTSSAPNSPAKRKSCRMSHQKLASSIGIDDFEIGEGSMTENSPPRKKSLDYTPYPVLVPDSNKVKKDAKYQKKFYRKHTSNETSPTSKTSCTANLSSGTMVPSFKLAETSSPRKVLTKKVEKCENIPSDNPIHSKADPSSVVDDSSSAQANLDSDESDKTRK